MILSAGTLGSSEILLRSRQQGLPLSDQVGAHFSGNGDVLAFAFDTDRPIHGIGFGTHKPGELPPVGPCITGIIDLRDTKDIRQGFVSEEGSIPGALAPLLPASFAALGRLEGVQMADSTTARLVERLKAAESLVLGSYRGAIDDTQTYLVMAHDGSEGQLMLIDDRLRIDWPEVGREQIFQTVNDKLEQIRGAGRRLRQGPDLDQAARRQPDLGPSMPSPTSSCNCRRPSSRIRSIRPARNGAGRCSRRIARTATPSARRTSARSPRSPRSAPIPTGSHRSLQGW